MHREKSVGDLVGLGENDRQVTCMPIRADSDQLLSAPFDKSLFSNGTS